MSTRVDLIVNGTATGNWQVWPGGPGVFLAEASNFNGATVKLQVKSPQGTALDVSGGDVDLTANGYGGFVAPQGEIRAAVITAVPTAVYAYALTV